MIGITAYSVVAGREVRSVEDIASLWPDAVQKQMRQIGLARIPTDNLRPLSEMIAEAYLTIGQKPDCVLIAHSLPFIRKTGEEIRELQDVPVFFLSGLPCVIMHKAVELAVRLISNGVYRRVIVCGADKAYSDRERVFFNTIMGDAVVALLLEEHGTRHRILATHVSTTIYAPDGENSPAEEIQRFRGINASMMRSAIRECLKKAGLTSVDCFVTHTSNRTFWDAVSKLMSLPRELFYDDAISETGHTNSHDSFLHYLHFYETGRVISGNNVMLINPGFGGSQGCTLIRV